MTWPIQGRLHWWRLHQRQRNKTAWKIARGRQELIPPEAIHLSDADVTEDDINRAQELIQEHG